MARTSILGNVAVKIGMQSAGFNKSLNKSLLKLKKFGKSAEKIGKTLSIGFTTPLVAGFAKSIMLFDKQAKAIAQVEQGLKTTGNAAGFTSKELQKMASGLQGITIFGDEDILKDVTSQLLTFTNISGDAFARTQKAALDLATRLDGDLKSASIQLGKALNDPVANLSALSRSGIQFSAQQKAVIKDLADTNQLAAAQAIILDELEKQYGGSAEAARKAGAGGLQALSNSFGDILERVGESLNPVLNRLVAFFDEIAVKASNLSDKQIRLGVAIGIAVAAIGPMIYVIGLLATAFVALATPLALKIAAIVALAVGINYLYQNAGALADRFVYAFNVAKEAVLDMTASAIDALASLVGVFDSVTALGLRGMAVDMRSGLGNIKKDFTEFKGFTETLTDTISALGEAFDNLFTGMQGGSNSSGGSGSRQNFGENIGRGSVQAVGSGPVETLSGIIELAPIAAVKMQELTNMQIAQSQALAQTFDQIADAFARTFVDGLMDIKNFGDAFKTLGKTVVASLKEIAAQMLKMAIIKGIGSILFPGAGTLLTGFDLARQAFSGPGKMRAGGAGVASAANKQSFSAKLFIDGQNVRTTYEIANRRFNRIVGS